MSIARLVSGTFFLVFGLLTVSPPVSAADFAGAGGVIPDGSANGLNIQFAVSGIVRPVGRVRIGVNLTHTFVGDLQATLTSPNGLARLVVFSRVGYKRGAVDGTSANLSGNYIFDDDATNDLWSTVAPIPDAGVVPPGTYRTSTAGRSSQLTLHGGCSTYLTLAFGGLSGAQVNGTWTLNVADVAGSDSGSVASALLTIEERVQIFSSGFEESGPGLGLTALSTNCRKAFGDFTGTGMSSYTVLRNTGGGPGGAMTWFVKNNDGTAAGGTNSFLLGNEGNLFLDGDFDGDGIADAAVWVPTTGVYTIRRSSRPTDTVLTAQLGQVGDDPTHGGDYDGDGVTDLTVVRAGTNIGEVSQTIIRLSSTGALRTLTTGENGSFPIGGIDYDGDRRADMGVQSNAGGGVSRLRLYNGITGNQFGDFTFGTPTDVMVLGSHTGSLIGDITMTRGSLGEILWTTRDTETGIGQPSVVFGMSATDFTIAGDFDGDGIDDYAIWRRSVNPGESKFSIRRSLNPGAPFDVPFGQNGDYPIGNARSN